MTDDDSASRWPAIPVAEWVETRDTLQLWMQIVGKVRMARTPMVNHWWNVPLYVSSRGFTTSLIPADAGSFAIDFDLIDHDLVISRTDGARRTTPLASRSVADFYTDVMGVLDQLDLSTHIWTMPVEIPDAIPFDADTTHGSYDPEMANRFWLAMVQADRALNEFRARFGGKSSPVHLFWGGLDLAVTRFSGRTAPPHPGGAPNCGPHVMWEAYSHEVSSAGYWPGGDGEGVFYSYAYPEPAGFRDVPVAPSPAHWDDALGEFVLDYSVVRLAEDPDAVLMEFLQTTYEAAANTAEWDRDALDRRD